MRRLLAFGVLVACQKPPVAPRPVADTCPRAPASVRDGQHDFDFEFGTWKTHLKRLVHPLSGSTTWAEYDGTTVVRKVADGQANLVELDVTGTTGSIKGISLRLYDASSHQWSLNFARLGSGSLTTPAVGQFKDGRGEFTNPDTLDGRPILVRFIISDITAKSTHFEQSFSADDGKTWEVNWVAVDTRQ